MNVSLLSEVPEGLYESLKTFLNNHPEWNQDQVFSSALSQFLLQNGNADPEVSKIYIGTVLREVG